MTGRDKSLIRVKQGIWLYLGLLIFEGAIRKWLAPHQFGNAIALMRDPVVLAIYLLAYRSRRFRGRTFLTIIAVGIAMSVLAALQIALGIATIPIVLFGLRSYLLHFPLIFVIAQTLTKEDLRRIGHFLMLVSIPMTTLIILQFRSSPESWLNTGAVEGSGQLQTSLGHIRPAGTFSFVTGVIEFFPLVFAFVIAEFAHRRVRFRTLLRSAAAASFLVIPFSGSRSLLIALCIVAAAAFVVATRNRRIQVTAISLSVTLLVLGLVVSQAAATQESLTAFQTRWREAAGDQTTADILADRVLKPVYETFGELQKTPVLGQGIGLGSNYAATVKTGAARFLLAEEEPIRLVDEAGIVGFVFMAYRAALCLQILFGAYRISHRYPLAFLLAAAAAPNLLFAIMEQPTNLGFIVLGTGLSCAALTQAQRQSRSTYRSSVGTSRIQVFHPASRKHHEWSPRSYNSG